MEQQAVIDFFDQAAAGWDAQLVRNEAVIGPAFAIAWNAIGSTTHSAMQSAQNARFFAEIVFFIGKLLCSILCAHYTRPSRSAEAPQGVENSPHESFPCFFPPYPL